MDIEDEIRIERLLLRWENEPKKREEILRKLIHIERKDSDAFNPIHYYISRLHGISKIKDKKIQMEMAEEAVERFFIMYDTAKGMTDLE